MTTDLLLPDAVRSEVVSPISVAGLTKRYGAVVAVADLSFDVRPGTVTGFLGPNGAGKTTTMRLLVGLARPTSGTALVFGQPYAQLSEPARLIGVLLDAATFHPRRSAIDHLRWAAYLARVGAARITEVVETVGLGDAITRRVGDFSLGMRQRLGLAVALLGEPVLLILDEPTNGLDPAGIRWLRQFLDDFASRGGTVLLSSHQLAEVAEIADDVVVVDRGRLVTQTSVENLMRSAAGSARVATPTPELLVPLLERSGAMVLQDKGAPVVHIRGMDASRVGEIAAAGGIVLHELSGEARTLEDVFFELTDHEGAAS